MNKFKLGDTVMLKSGGAVMTVIDVGAHLGRIVCEWTRKDGCPTEASFKPECLTLLEKSK